MFLPEYSKSQPGNPRTLEQTRDSPRTSQEAFYHGETGKLIDSFTLAEKAVSPTCDSKLQTQAPTSREESTMRCFLGVLFTCIHVSVCFPIYVNVCRHRVADARG